MLFKDIKKIIDYGEYMVSIKDDATNNMLDLVDSDTKLDNYEVYKIEGVLDQDNDCIVHIIVGAKPNATKYYWELRVINADFEEVFYYFTTDFMFDEEWIHLSDHNYEYDLVMFKDNKEIEEMSSYYTEYEKLPQDIKDMLSEFIVKNEEARKCGKQ